MSRLLYRLSYTALTCLCRGARNRTPRPVHRAPIRNRTVDLLLTMETLYRLSYWGGSGTYEPFLWSREKITRPRRVDEIGYPFYDSRVSTVSSRRPLACAVRAWSHASRRSSDSGREIRYPCATSQPIAASWSRAPSSSTPSATTVSPSECPSSTMERTTARSPRSLPMPNTKLLSIFTSSTGNCRRYASEL